MSCEQWWRRPGAEAYQRVESQQQQDVEVDFTANELAGKAQWAAADVDWGVAGGWRSRR